MKNVIYKISNKINQKIYVGSAKYFNRRYNLHKHHLLKNTHPNKILQNFVNKYGFDNLIFEIIETCDEGNLLNREQFYIDNLNPEFNVHKIANSPKGLKRTEQQKANIKNGRLNNGGYAKGWNHSEEAKKKISLAHKGKVVTELQKKKQSEKMTGKVVSIETRIKISNSTKGKVFNDATIKKLSQSKLSELNPNYGKIGELHHNYGKSWKQKNPKQSKQVIDKSTNTIYKSAKEASDLLGIGYSTLYKYLMGQNPNVTKFEYYYDTK
jgi:group I intron endonuclease